MERAGEKINLVIQLFAAKLERLLAGTTQSCGPRIDAGFVCVCMYVEEKKDGEREREVEREGERGTHQQNARTSIMHACTVGLYKEYHLPAGVTNRYTI